METAAYTFNKNVHNNTKNQVLVTMKTEHFKRKFYYTTHRETYKLKFAKYGSFISLSALVLSLKHF